ncbi:amino acid ABC transporter permease [Clostridium sp. HV4-5-A1G]|jgi:putative amino-acid transport system permease protein|uniref:amino acid ABC transporter permease n=1 Tax=Clostridium sp. HV4-5-A1G TaxID=2004595 RepID=UPI00123992F6|nr:amino acid ABC transporter permease [Clostridium sp. HV4-5-A1G]KAA8679359.1 amino acid ABC transporter permease [Clostridium sp. HV4-5-A1G]CAB1262487.1 putative sulfur aminoacid ABC transporter (permease) [Clostridiaceae bacterium BL-3]
MSSNLIYIKDSFVSIIEYTPLDVSIAVASMFFAVLLGLLIALIRNNKVPVLSSIATLYVLFFRSIPTLVELFLIYYGLPQLIKSFSSMDAFTASIIGLSLKEAAYLGEIFRAALNSVDKGQLEACLGVGISKFNAYRRIILPQAALNALPATSNTFISLIKETSLVFTLGVTELFAQGKILAAASMNFFQTYLIVAIIYCLLVGVASALLRLLEKKLSRPYLV